MFLLKIFWWFSFYWLIKSQNCGNRSRSWPPWLWERSETWDLTTSPPTCPVERGVKTLFKTNRNALSIPNNSSTPVCMRQYILKKGCKCSPLLRIRTQNSYFVVLSSCFIKLIHCTPATTLLRYEHKILIYQLFSLTFISEKAFSEVALNDSVFEAPFSNLTDSYGECCKVRFFFNL